MTPPRMIREIAAIIPFVWKEECLRCEAGGGGNWQPDEPGCCPKGLGNFPSGAEDSESGQGGKSGTVCFWRGDGTGPAEEAAVTHTVGGGGNESFAGLIRFDRQIALYEWLLPEGAAVEYPLHQDALGEHRQSLFAKRDWLCSEAGAKGDPADPGNHERSPVHRKHGNAGGRLAVAAESLEERVPS